MVADDFNGDGYDDLAVGVPGERYGDNGLLRAGSVNVIYGSIYGPQLGDLQVFFQGQVYGLADGPEADDYFGYTLAASDFDGDGYGDLVVGVPYEDLVYGGDTLTDAGCVHVIYGAVPKLTHLGDTYLYQNEFTIKDAPGNYEKFGLALAAVPGMYYRIMLPLVLSDF